jgi:outer membrane protein assembly factor BamA
MRNSYPKPYQLIVCLLMLLATACNNKKHLQKGEYLYEGANIKLEAEKPVEHRKQLMTELNQLLFPDPNTKTFGIARTKLWFYNITEEPEKDKGLKHWLKYKVGEPPVLLEQTDPIRIEKLLHNRLYNKGYFENKVDYKINYGDKEASIDYQLQVEDAYQLDTINYPEAQHGLLGLIAGLKSTSLLQTGENYDLDVMKKERQRITEEVRSKGYYYFDPDFILFEADTTLGKKKCNIYLTLKENIQAEYLDRYSLGKIYVFPDYDLSDIGANSAEDTVVIDKYHYLKQDSAFIPEVITDAIYFEPGDVFSSRSHEYTVNKLNGLQAFQFVSIKYVPDSTQRNTLNVLIHLTPYMKKSIRLELSGITKSNGFTGPGFEASFRNRNAMRGAELLTVKFTAGYETQISSSTRGLNSYELGVETKLEVPRFVLPFRWSSSLSRFTPYTIYKVGYNTLNRVQFFRLSSIDASFGYRWKESYSKQHELLPVNLNYVQLGKSEPAFEAILAQNPLVRRSFEEQFIIGSIYSFTYDSRLDRDDPGQFYYKGTADLSGNIAQLLNGGNFNEETDYELLGIPFSQYFRLENIFKYYFEFNEETVLANRLIAGVGIPVGNSSILPYVKQFFIGGSNSIRAFQPRTVGPGTYTRGENQNGNIFIDQSGDLKFEVNSELRFLISGIFKGAVFIDAGNIWLANRDSLRPGGKFEANNFLSELAVGYGFGLRIDPDFFVLRLDLGFPLKTPKEEDVSIRSRQINQGTNPDNFVLNIAIGYPF